MAAYYMHPSYAGRLDKPPSLLPDAPAVAPVLYPGLLRIMAHADRACCCTASPSVMAIMPAAPGHSRRTELLLCMHHIVRPAKGWISGPARSSPTKGPRARAQRP